MASGSCFMTLSPEVSLGGRMVLPVLLGSFGQAKHSRAFDRPIFPLRSSQQGRCQADDVCGVSILIVNSKCVPDKTEAPAEHKGDAYHDNKWTAVDAKTIPRMT